MDVWLLGGAIVLIAITVWIVFWPARATTVPTAAAPQADELTEVPEEGTSVEYAQTSEGLEAKAEPSAFQAAGEAWSSPTIAHEGLPAAELSLTTRAFAATGSKKPATAPKTHGLSGVPPRTIGLGAAALLTLCGALVGAWLYARWQRERNRPINRLKRRLVK